MADRFKWERAVIGRGGPANPTTRHVLLTLATHAKDLQCWPTTKLLAQETGLSERAVCTHLEIAEQEGWIYRQARKEGKAWKNYVYTLTTAPVRTEPRSAANGVNGTEPRSAGSDPNGHESLHASSGTERGADGAERHADGTERDDSQALNDVQSNNVPNTSSINKGNTTGSGEASHAPSCFSSLKKIPEHSSGDDVRAKRSEELRQQGLQYGVTWEPRMSMEEYAMELLKVQVRVGRGELVRKRTVSEHLTNS